MYYTTISITWKEIVNISWLYITYNHLFLCQLHYWYHRNIVKKYNAFVHSKTEREWEAIGNKNLFYSFNSIKKENFDQFRIRGFLTILLFHLNFSTQQYSINACSVKQKAENIFNVIKYFVTLDICSPCTNGSVV